MGTNYYARINECEWCGRYKRLKLGKSSAGWCFTLRVYPEKGISTLDDLIEFLDDNMAKIYDEYERKIPLKKFLKVVTERSWPINKKNYDFSNDNFYKDLNHFLEINQAELGPNNLLRHKIDGQFCIGHGEGTWDYCIGDFS